MVQEDTDSLLQTIVSRPEDLDARRKFAAMHKGDRGRFIDLQIEAAAELARSGRSEKYRALRREYQEIEQRHGASWTPDLRYLDQPAFIRGFVEQATVTAEVLLTRERELFAAAPLRGLVITDYKPHIRALANARALDRLIALQFYDRTGAGKLDDADLAKLVPRFERLLSLDVSFNAITNQGVRDIAGLPGLRFVNLTGNPASNPIEEVSTDEMTGSLVPSGHLPIFGQELEREFGRRAWYERSRFLMAPRSGSAMVPVPVPAFS